MFKIYDILEKVAFNKIVYNEFTLIKEFKGLQDGSHTKDA